MPLSRRDLLKSALGAAGASVLNAQTGTPSLKTARTSVLEIAYNESGPADGFPVILMHGFPDDAHAYDDVAPPLAGAGYRVIVPWIRGYGKTKFLDPSAPRMAEQAAIGQDIVDLADALHLTRFAVGGFDWGGRASAVAAALYPNRVAAALLIGGYSIQNPFGPPQAASPEAVEHSWYQWYFNTASGRVGLQKNRKALCRYMWQTWSPTWKFSDELYEKTAVSFENPDFVDCVIHSYRHRIGNAAGEPRFEAVERELAKRPPITVPVMTIYGGDDGFGHPSPDITPAEKANLPQLAGHRIAPGAGHFVPHEKPEMISSAMLDLLKLRA
jgi:pimeloyl-ACP methyl ester carboxylesterase